MRSFGKNCCNGGCSFRPRTNPVATRRFASRTASGPRVGSMLTNGSAMSALAVANASTSSFDTHARPDSRSSTENTMQAILRER